MKRPLALFGAAYLAAAFISVFLPQQSTGAAAAFLVFAAVLLTPQRRIPPAVRVCAPACALAFLGMFAYQTLAVAPLVRCAGEETALLGTVMQIEPGYGGDSGAVIRISEINGRRCAPGMCIRVESLPEVEMGDFVTLSVEPEPVAYDQYRFSSYADGIFLEADEALSCAVTGASRSPVFALRRARDVLAQNIRWLLHDEVGEIAAAMSLGDRSGLSRGTQSMFRRAGLSHVLVVSGLHLSMVSEFVYRVFKKRLSSRASAGLACLATVVFMCMVGFTPSVVRAGSAMLLMNAGRLFRRRSDGFTSLGLSAFLLCAANPYAAVDVGLLLSYAAAFAVMSVSAWERRAKRRDRRENRTLSLPVRAARAAIVGIAVPASTCLATLPVLASIGSGVSLWSIPANIIAVPLTGAAVLTGLAAALAYPVPLLEDALSFVCGALLTLIVKTAQLAASLPGGYFRMTSVLQTIPVIAAVALFALGCRWKLRRTVNLLCAAAVLAVGLGAQAALSADVAEVSVVGSGTSPSIVITLRGEAVVLYRGSVSMAGRVSEWLAENGSPQVVLAVCLDEDATVQEREWLCEELGASECAGVSQRLAAQPIRDIMIVADTQKSGAYAVADVGGYLICVGSGTVDFTLLPRVNLFIAGGAEPKNLSADAVLLLRQNVEWAQSVPAVKYISMGECSVRVRVGRSAVLRGVSEV